MSTSGQPDPNPSLAAGVCEYRDGGLYVPALDCWLDSHQPRRRGFISHAHTDHYAPHEAIICTPETAEMLAFVKPFEDALPPIRPLRLGRTIEHGGARATLLPSGHILGAAMMHVECGGHSLLYSGDVRPSGSSTTPPAQVVPADHLVVEDTFGALDEGFVDAAEGAARVVEFCRKCREQNKTPVLVTTSSCGKAQEMVVALAEAGLSVALQSKIWHFTRLYARYGVPVAGYTRLRKEEWPDADAVIMSRAYLRHDDLKDRVPRPAYALVSGWAASEEGASFDAAIPWSDHASKADLLAFIEAVNPRVVWTFAGEGRLLPELRAAGREAVHLEEC